MNVRDLMEPNAAFCRPETNLASAAAAMWEHNCGILPVVDEWMRVTGVITDRDICIALATRNCRASELTTGEVSTGIAYTCGTDEDIQGLLSIMRTYKVRRVPVINDDGTLAGIVSIDDMVMHARERKGGRKSDITYADVIEAQKAIVARPIFIGAEQMDGERNETVHANDFDFEE